MPPVGAPESQAACRQDFKHEAAPQPAGSVPQVSPQMQPGLDGQHVTAEIQLPPPPPPLPLDPLSCALEVIKQYGVTDMDKAKCALETIKQKEMTIDE